MNQLLFPSLHVIPCIAVGIDQHQILMDWMMFLNLSLSDFVAASDVNGGHDAQRVLTRPPVRFLAFNGRLRPKLRAKTKTKTKRKRKWKECKYGVIADLVGILKQRASNREHQYLCVYLEPRDRNDLFLKLMTFSLHFLCDDDPNWIVAMNRKIEIYKIWWTNHCTAKWIQFFGEQGIIGHDADDADND